MKKLLLNQRNLLKVFCSLSFVLLFVNVSWGQTTVFSETFGTTASSPYTGGTSTTPSNISYTVSTTNATISRVLDGSDAYVNFVSSNVSSRPYLLAPFSSLSNINTTLSSNTVPVEWTFNMKTQRGTVMSSNSSYSDGSYYSVVILCATSSNITSTTTGTNGYAVIFQRLTGSTTQNSIRLVKFNNGLISTSTYTKLIESAALVNLTRSQSVKVIYTPTGSSAGTWELFTREDATSTTVNPTTGTLTTAGTSTDATYTGTAMTHFGVLASLNTSTSVANSFQFDNLRIAVYTPTINAPSVNTLSGFTATSSTSSAEQSFTISGQYLTNSIVATAPSDYEVSTTSGSGFGATATLTNTATQSAIIYVRLKSGLADGSKTGNITIASTGATTTSSYTVALSGSVASTPTLVPNVASLTQFANTAAAANSASSNFTLSGVNLTSGNVTVTAPTNFAVSTNNSTFSSSVTITPSSGAVSSTIYVRYSPTGSGGYSGNVVIAWSGLTDQNVSVSGYLSTFYYKLGSTSLATPANWSGTADGTGTSVPNNFTTDGVTYKILSSTTTTDVSWNVAGTGSIISVGDPSVAGVTLTLASGFDITTAFSPVVGNGAIDIPAALSGANSVVLQNPGSPPNFGTMHATSEVHYQAAISTGTTKTFGKIFIENNSSVSFSGTPTIQTTLNVAAGSTLSTSSTSSVYITVNTGGTVVINGTLLVSKAKGLFVSNTPGSYGGAIQFFGTENNLTLGALSTVEYNKATNASVYSITGMPYVNLTISGLDNNKTLASAATVSGTLTLNISGTSTVTGLSYITLANGATIVRSAGSFDAAPIFGASVNVSYNASKMTVSATTITLSSTSVTLSATNTNITVGMGVSGSGIPTGTTVTSISGTAMTLSNAATAAGTSVALTFDIYLPQTSSFEIPTTTTVLNNLTINNSAGVTLGANTTVNGLLTLTSGVFAKGSSSITLVNGATIVRTAGSLDAAPTFGSTVNVSYGGTLTTQSGTTTASSSSVTLSLANALIAVGMPVSGTGIAAGTTVSSISGTALGLSTAATATGTGPVTLSFAYNTALTSSNEIPTDATKLNNLTINHPAGVTLASATNLNNKLTVTSGVLTTGGFLTLKSKECCTAYVGQLAAGAVSGDVTVERYIPAKRAWRALTAPVVGSTNNSVFYNWQNNGNSGTSTSTGVEIWSNAPTNASVTTGGGGSSMLSYSSSGNSWSGITDTSTTASLFSATLNSPFMVFLTGPYASTNISSGATATTLKATGSLIIGTQTYATTGLQYTFIGNPYASPLSLTAMLADTDNLTNFSNGIWIWDSNGNATVGSYNYFDKIASAYSYTLLTTSISNPIVSTAEIQSGQAFFVKSVANATFSIKEAHKGTSVINTVFRDAAPAQLLRVGLYKQINSEWSGRDGAMTVITPDADANQTPNKMANGTENVAFNKNSGLFASNHHLPLIASDVLNVKVWNTTAGTNYKLKIYTEEFTSNLTATLEDLFTNARTPLPLDGSAVDYPFAVTTDALSTGNRFRIVFQTSALGINNPKANGFSVLPNPVTGDSFQVNLGILATGTYSYSICNALGQEVEKGSINNVAQNTNYTVKFRETAATGIYIMKIKGTDNSVFTAKIIKK